MCCYFIVSYRTAIFLSYLLSVWSSNCSDCPPLVEMHVCKRFKEVFVALLISFCSNKSRSDATHLSASQYLKQFNRSSKIRQHFTCKRLIRDTEMIASISIMLVGWINFRRNNGILVDFRFPPSHLSSLSNRVVSASDCI